MPEKEAKDEIVSAAESFGDFPHDLVEWRADWFDGVYDFEKVHSVLESLREVLGDTPLLFTFKTSKEGGEKSIEPDSYVNLNKKACESGLIDLVDCELFIGDDTVKEIIECAHKNNVKVIASNHDFEKTPARDELVSHLKKMRELGADIPKIAVMPQSEKDVLTLLSETEEASQSLGYPIITISMGGKGLISRLADKRS